MCNKGRIFKVLHSGLVQDTRVMSLLTEDVQCAVIKEEEADIVNFNTIGIEG